jgi:gamma-glutamyltranspeptidase/glutathione hydrolase
VLLNNEMDDFASSPGAPNAYGLIGGAANEIAGGKRPLSSMTPTFLESSDRLAILGTPGGSRISSMVLLATLEFASGNTADALVAAPRYHHQYLPDRIEYEPAALTGFEISGLKRLGHRLSVTAESYGDMQVIIWNKRTGKIEAASDPRGEGCGVIVTRWRNSGVSAPTCR